MECLADNQDSNCTVTAFVVSCCEVSGVANLIVEKANKYIQQQNQDNSQFVMIGRSPTEVPSTVCEFFVRLFRKYGLHQNERETVLGPADQLIATQLVLSLQNQRDLGHFDIDVSKVLEVNNKLIYSKLSSVVGSNKESSSTLEETSFAEFLKNYNSFLRHCNSVDWMDVVQCMQKERHTNLELQNYIQGSHFLVLNPTDDFVERNLIRELAKGKECAILSTSLSLNESFGSDVYPHSAEFSVENCSMDEVLSCASSSSVVTSSLSVGEAFALHVFLAYLELLLNSRNELALARVINIPDRKLDHGAFTCVKHEANKRNLSMYQTIISFVTRARLGGKSYAPTADCPLVPHSEGLVRFTDFMDKLQTIIEENTLAESAIRRVVNVIRTSIRGSIQQLKMSTVEKVASHLLDQMTVVLKSMYSEPLTSPTQNASDGGSLAGRQTLRVIRTLLDHFASLPSTVQSIDILTDTFASSQKTPVRFPSLMSKFRSPEEQNADPSLVERLAKRIVVNENKTKIKLSVRQQSCFDWVASDAMSSDCRLLSTTDHVTSNASRKSTCTKRLLESSRDKENEMQQQEQLNDVDKLSVSSHGETLPTRITLQLTDSNTKETMSKRKAEMQPAVAKKSRGLTKAKTIPQVKGQQKLGTFFRV